jgi:hypothetical protein
MGVYKSGLHTITHFSVNLWVITHNAFVIECFEKGLGGS